jgi:hypothetical protein
MAGCYNNNNNNNHHHHHNHNFSVQFCIYLRDYSAAQRPIIKLTRAKERHKRTHTNKKQKEETFIIYTIA